MGTLDQKERFINLNYRSLIIPTNAGWTESNVNGAIVQAPMEMKGNTSVVASSRALAECSAVSMCIEGAGTQANVDWDRRLSLAFDIARIGSDNQALARFQLKEINTEGVLAAKGIGIQVAGYGLSAEAYDTARETKGLAIVLADDETFRVQIEHIPGKGVEFYVNRILRTILTREPSGVAGAASYFVMSIINGAAGGVDAIFKVSNIELIQSVE